MLVEFELRYGVFGAIDWDVLQLDKSSRVGELHLEQRDNSETSTTSSCREEQISMLFRSCPDDITVSENNFDSFYGTVEESIPERAALSTCPCKPRQEK
jgi:hypothetical protein